MIDETGKDIGITELEAEENRENNSMSFDEIEIGGVKKNDKIDVEKVELEVPTEEPEETEEEDYEETEGEDEE